jgi:hypothetical protein
MDCHTDMIIADEDQADDRLIEVVGRKFYVSPHGVVKEAITGHVKKQCTRTDGYKAITFENGRDWRKTRLVHAIVAEAFIGPRPPGLVLRHLDGTRDNNHYKNLAYGTHKDNMADALRHGTVCIADDKPNAKLTSLGIAAIRRLDGLVPADIIAARWGVSLSIIRQAARDETWRSVDRTVELEEALRLVFTYQTRAKRNSKGVNQHG